MSWVSRSRWLEDEESEVAKIAASSDFSTRGLGFEQNKPLNQRLHRGAEYLHLLRISEFFGFQWHNLAEILSLLSEGQFDPILG